MVLSNGPEVILKNYLTANKNLEYSIVHDLLSEKSKRGLTKEEYLIKNKSESNIFTSFASRVDYTIEKIIEQNDSAIGIVTFKIPDMMRMSELQSRMMPLLMIGDTDGLMKLNFDSIYVANYPDNNFPVTIHTDTIYLI